MRHWTRGPGHPCPSSSLCVLLPLPLRTHSNYTGAGLLSVSPAFCIQDLLPVSLKTTANLPSQLHLLGALPCSTKTRMKSMSTLLCWSWAPWVSETMWHLLGLKER